MPNKGGQEKTEQATGKRLHESREKGQVAKSQEINSFTLMLLGFVFLYFFGSIMGEKLSMLATTIFSSLDQLEMNIRLLEAYAHKGILFMGLLLAPVFLTLVIASLIAGYGQVGFKITPKALKPDFKKFNPIKGIKNLFFSSKSIAELAKSVFKLAIMTWLSYIVLSDIIVQSVTLVDYSIHDITSFMIVNAFDFIWKFSLAYAVLALADFLWQKHKHKKDLMMTKQEVKDENKQSEGDPLVKGKIRSKQIEASRRRLTSEVPEADVVITNPTHYAVALKYQMGGEGAPKVVAKGVDLMAKRIRDIATEHGIPLHEDPPLARALYKYCDEGDEIPQHLFRAVAQILAYVFKKRNVKKKQIV